MALALGQDWVDELNRLEGTGGKFIRAAELTESPGLVRYWADHEEPITFNGHQYIPLQMRWDNIKTSQSMTIEGWNVSVSNLAGQATRYLKEIDPSGCPVWLRLLHTRLLASTTVHWQRYGKVLAVRTNIQVATFTIGRDLGRNMQPNEVFLIGEFPSLVPENPRIL